MSLRTPFTVVPYRYHCYTRLLCSETMILLETKYVRRLITACALIIVVTYKCASCLWVKFFLFIYFLPIVVLRVRGIIYDEYSTLSYIIALSTVPAVIKRVGENKFDSFVSQFCIKYNKNIYVHRYVTNYEHKSYTYFVCACVRVCVCVCARAHWFWLYNTR